MKMIKLSDDHYVVVDDIGIDHNLDLKKDDWCYRDTNIVLQVTQELLDYYSSIKSTSKHNAYKITHSTQPIEEWKSVSYGGDGTIRKKIYDKIKPLSLQEVKELLGVVDVEKMAEEALISHPDFKAEGYSDYQNGRFNGIVEGYNIALEDNKDKKYTEDDLRKAIDIAQKESWDEGGYLGKEHEPDEIIQTLQPKTEWDVEFVDGKLKLI